MPLSQTQNPMMLNEKIQKTILISFILLCGLLLFGCSPEEPQWPEITQESKPWTRWWWMGNAVNPQDLTRQMELYRAANLGGVEITPIYGVAGYENQFTDFLSPEWMEMLEHTLSEGERLDLGIDMATGTGWPFGGPMIEGDEASKRIYYKTYELNGGQQFNEQISYTQEPFLRSIQNTIYELHGFLKAEDEEPQGSMDEPRENPGSEPINISDIQEPLSQNENLQELAIEQVRFEKSLSVSTLMAYSDEGTIINLTEEVDENGQLEWNVPEGNWTLYALFTGWHGKTVERAAPGGEGFVIDHFSEDALEHYLAAFDSTFSGDDIGSLRSFFNDSYEVDDAEGEANWTPDFFDTFEEKRGYDLREHLPALLEERDTETGMRVLTDYRETVSDLLVEEFTRPWDSWAEGQGALTRNQAHGSPANILDLYAASDIPETEGTDIIRAKMASSAANVTGKRLASSETATWLDEHFSSSLSDVKRAVDRFFISGINHIVYHGTAYSPDEDEWPGWLFYAAVHFNERNPFWNHFGDFNSYVARVQSFLQTGKSDNDILFYYPVHDQWATPGPGLLRHFDGGLDENMKDSFLNQGAEWMVEKGYSFDFISDLQLLDVVVTGDTRLNTGGLSYKTIVVPKNRFIPIRTFERLRRFAEDGATVILYGGLPGDVPGLFELDRRQRRLEELVTNLPFEATEYEGIQEATAGKGRFIQGDSLDELFEYTEVYREPMTDHELKFVRRSHDNGFTYFITNWGDEKVDEWVPLSRQATSAYIFDPVHKKTGYASVRSEVECCSEIYLQLHPGESLIVQTFNSGSRESAYPYLEPAGEAQSIDGNWTLRFTRGGPELPPNSQLQNPVLWTDLDGELYDRFSGTAEYHITLERSSESTDGWLLNLGEVYESASVYLNGQKRGTLLGPEYELYISPEWMKEENELVIEVSNLMANRIAWMDQEGIQWKKFYNVNFPSRLAENRNEQGIFDASGWSPHPSGLEGPVTLMPVQLKEPGDFD